MSFSKILASSLMLSNGEIVRSPRSFPTREIEQDRRYFQLKEFMKHYNREFDEKKYWTYGCNCHVLGDRPMSDPGFGPPVDRLDSVCKQYKDCNKCAREKFGESCIGEIVQYRYGLNVSVISASYGELFLGPSIVDRPVSFKKIARFWKNMGLAILTVHDFRTKTNWNAETTQIRVNVHFVNATHNSLATTQRPKRSLISNITLSTLLKMEVLGFLKMIVRNQEDQHIIHNAVQIRKTNFGPILVEITRPKRK